MNEKNCKPKIDFYYWDFQCPLNFDMLLLLREFGTQIDIKTYNVSNNFDLAKSMNMFFPTLTVINNKYKHYSPLSNTFLESVCKGIIPEEKPYILSLGDEVYRGNIIPITDKNSEITCVCTGGCTELACERKKKFRERTGDDNYYGFAQIDHAGELVGGVEWISSINVPYDIPKSSDFVFLTCVYTSNEVYDYKTAVLQESERYLSQKYREMYVISDESSVFPNGNIDLFIRNGYFDCGVIYEDLNYCRLHLLRKTI